MNYYQNEMGQPNLPDIATQQMLALGRELQVLSQTVAANNRYMADTVHMEVERAERERRKYRKKEVSSCVTVMNDCFCLAKCFDDGTRAVEELILNLVSDFEIYRFQLKGIEESQTYAGIHFRTEDFWLIEEISKISGKKIYEDLVKKGVSFNAKISKSKIRECLYAFFAPKIEKAGVVQIPALAGWFRKEFLSAENFWFRENEGLQELPIRRKRFPNCEDSILCPEKYFEEIRNIKDWKNRIWAMLCPVGGMLSSFLWEAGITPEKCLNFVILTDIPAKKLRRYLQVFNRNGQVKQEIRWENILQIKDEVLILDASTACGESSYKKEQKIQKFQAIAERMINGEFVTEDGLVINCPVVLFSDRIIRKKWVMNLFVDDDFFKSRENREWVTQKEDEIAIVFFYFMKYCENNFDEIQEILKMGKEADPKTAWLCFAFKIFRKFWKSKGIDMMKMADLPESIDFRDLLQEDLMFEDDLLADFRKIIREEIGKWSVKQKNDGKGDGTEILYTEEFIWIPVKILNLMISKYGILDQRYQFLEKLKNDDFLVTDERGMSRKVQVSGNRYEAYQFRRGLFHTPGLIDIVELGKEDANVER